MSRKLVLYFSVYGTTKIIAETVAMQINADISAIESAVPYDADRNLVVHFANDPVYAV